MAIPRSVNGSLALSLALFLGVLLSCGGQSDEVPADAAEDVTRPAITVRSAVDRSLVTVGSLVRFTLEVEYDAELLIDRLELGEQLGDLEVVDSGRSVLRVVRGQGGLVDWVVLRGTAVGSYIVPPQVISGTTSDGETVEAESDQVFVEIVSVLDEQAEDIRGLKPLEERASLVPWFVAAAVLAVLAVVLWLWRRRREEVEEVVVLLAHERAFRDLEALRSTDFTHLDELRRYYFSLSLILRRYIEDRFALNATDLTSQELVQRLDEIGPLQEVQEASLVDFCQATDSVKYAAQVPKEREIEEVYEAALIFVEQTAEDPQEDSGTNQEDGPVSPGPLDVAPRATEVQDETRYMP